MSLDSDIIVDRRRIRRKLTFWRVVAVLIAIIAVIGIAGTLRGSMGTGATLVQQATPQISRVTIRGIIRGDQDRIKALEVAEEKEAIAQYGSSDSGATLGDILGTALKRATEKKD